MEVQNAGFVPQDAHHDSRSPTPMPPPHLQSPPTTLVEQTSQDGNATIDANQVDSDADSVDSVIENQQKHNEQKRAHENVRNRRSEGDRNGTGEGGAHWSNEPAFNNGMGHKFTEGRIVGMQKQKRVDAEVVMFMDSNNKFIDTSQFWKV